MKCLLDIKLKALLTVVIIFCLAPNLVFAYEPKVPTKDKTGSNDYPGIKRYEGSVIVYYDHSRFNEFTFPLSKLIQDGKNRKIYLPAKKIDLKGRYARIVYIAPTNRSTLEVIENYKDEIKKQNGKILFECKGGACGGKSKSLFYYLYPGNKIKVGLYSSGYCVLRDKILDKRFTVAYLPERNVHISILSYSILGEECAKYRNRTAIVVDILEGKAREKKMVLIKAEEMAEKIAANGKISLYGIYFDTNKASLKPESKSTLEQIGKLLKSNSALKLLVVGHTDDIGGWSYNSGLSKKRAVAVVNALIIKFKIQSNRLTAVGVAYASPKESNKSELGRAKNRRVELVDNSRKNE